MRTTGATLAAVAATALAAGAVVAGGQQVARAAPGLAPLLGPGGTTISANAVTGLSAASVARGSYVVVLENAAAGQGRAAATRAARLGGAVGHTYGNLFQGYSATLSAGQLAAVREDPAVKYVQTDMVLKAAGTNQNHPGTWGLDRIDQRKLPVNDLYYYNSTGAAVKVYVMDTGIYAGHPDFAGQVQPGVDEVGSTNGTVDCEGHGTQVAGTIGGLKYGVAKRTQLYPVRVLDCSGSGATADTLAGLDWIDQQSTTRRSVVNMSLSGAFDQALNDAVQQMISSGIPVVAATGTTRTGRSDACDSSPGSVPGAITVAPSTYKDTAALYSQSGPCLDLYAPGEDITSDTPGRSNGAFTTDEYSGGSAAAAHVTGVAAMYLERHPAATPAQVSAWIASAATPDVVTGGDPAYPHDLLFSLEAKAPPAGVSGGDRLTYNQNLVKGTRLYSANQAYFLAFRSKDSWLCVYAAASGKVVWCSGHSGVYAHMGISYLATYDTYARKSWQTPNGPIGGRLTMIVNGKGYLMIKQDDGKVLWSTPH